ncbi:unnamed protein product [Thlaspi arvense]|uniref:Defensin-like domain-containing protein n=1 Tax=Thlaspi arvense TaxID=13288 RepID=A0AAU9STE3_THLAR|nr:unnamed protein product [Thlaspi arvense]
MNFIKTYVSIFLVLVLTISFSNYIILAKPAMRITDYKCIEPCATFYGNRKCYNDCISHHYDGGQCDGTEGGKPPQCCCYNYTDNMSPYN